MPLYFNPEALFMFPIFILLIFIFCKLENLFVAGIFAAMYLALTEPKPLLVDMFVMAMLYNGACNLYDAYLSFSKELKQDES